MTSVKSNHMFKRLGAFVMATAMACCMAVTAGAVDAGDYDIALEVPGLPAGHNLDFFDTATVENDGGVSTVIIPVVEGEVFGVTGNVVDAEISDAAAFSGYEVSFDTDNECIVITCPESISTEAFRVGVTFTVETDGMRHIDATGYMSLVTE